MGSLNFSYETADIEKIIFVTKNVIFALLTYYTNFKIINKRFEVNVFSIFNVGEIIGAALLSTIFKWRINSAIGIFCLFFLISMIFSFYRVSNNVTITLASMTINYSIWFISIIAAYLVNKVIRINKDYINFILIITFHIIILFEVFNTRKWKHGITFFKENIKNEYIDILMLNVCSIFLLIIMMLEIKNIQLNLKTVPIMTIGIVALCITIQKILQLYYKQKLLVKELEYTKQELNKAKADNKRLEQENLNFSKTSHSIAHKQKVLEYKINKMLGEKENEDAIKIKKQVTKIAEKIYVNPTTNLNKTEIPKVDDMLEYMQSECTKNNIEFCLQINGNVHYIINNIITENELEILLADHIKDAIIAIKHTDNLNKSILVKIGKIDETYGIYIYDSGIEFKEETLQNIGKKPITTHKDEGGTGMGFMNTFETLSKCKGSLIIKEIGNVSKDNFTKAVMIKFDGKGEYKVISYKYDEIKINKKIQNFV